MKAKQLLFATLGLIAASATTSYAQLGVNTTSPNPKTLMHVKEVNDGNATTYKGIMIPTFTTAERDANFTGLTAADNGLMIYNKTQNCYNFWRQGTTGTGMWINMCDEMIPPTSTASGIIGSYIGAPIILKGSSTNGQMNKPNWASATNNLGVKQMLAKDDWIQMDFGGNPTSVATVLLRINNITTNKTLSFTGTSISNNAINDPNTPRNYTNIAPGTSTNPTIDPYGTTLPAPDPNIFGYSSTFSEQVVYVFSVTDGTETRNYYAVWTSYPSHEVGGGAGTTGGIRTELYRYNP